MTTASRLAGLAGLSLTFALARPALAQSVGYQVNRFEPTPASDPFFVVEYPWYASSRSFAGGLTLDLAHDVVAAGHLDGNGNLVIDPSPVSSQFRGHLNLAASFTNRIALTLSAPVVLNETGTAASDLGPSGTVGGDPRLGARALLWGSPDSKLSLSAAAYFWIPVGVENDLAGDSQVRFMPRLTAGGRANPRVRWAANASFLRRATAQLSNTLPAAGNVVGSEVQVSGAVSYVAMGGRLSVGPEAVVAVSVIDLPAPQKRLTFELFAAGHYAVTDQIQLGLGLGLPVTSSHGSTDFRALFSVAWSPRRGPRLSSFEQVVLLPDEDGHVGGIDVQSEKQTTVLDKPYASSKISKKNTRLQQVQSSAEEVARDQRLGSLAKNLPAPDRDHDGVADATDACPERAGIASTDPIRHGCPKASEKVVVLPDADGHVGGIEVDDGQTTTVVDQAYASAEVGADGRAKAGDKISPKALETAVASIASALPIADQDGDGIADEKDSCPDRPGVAGTDPVRNGCPLALEKVIVVPGPDGHVGGVEVDDGKTKVVLDKPYQSTEVAPDGTAKEVPPASPKAVERSLKVIGTALPILDTDKDGIREEDDACPDRPGVASPDPIRNGCPKSSERVVVVPDADGHVGGLEVNDGKTITVLDKAFATTEVGTDGRAQAVPSSPALAVQRSIISIANVLPPADRDNDGIPDTQDACPDRVGVRDAERGRSGCPRAVERIIVIPDEDGHVGSIEVDNGKTKTVVDTAYGTAEIGTDGQAHKLVVVQDEVEEKFAPAMAARPAGARIIIYFTEQAQPVRDLTDAIANVVAEVKLRGKYQVEVRGHTDATGTEAANKKVGLARAQLIVDRLIAAGLDKQFVSAVSRGSSEPAIQNRNRTAVEFLNRRVEVYVK